MRMLGVDPGLSGGLAVVATTPSFNRPYLIDACDVPVVGVDAKRRVNVIGVMEWIRKHSPDACVFERAQAMPDQGSSSGFIYGRAVGALETCVVGLLIPITFIEASAWKKAHGLAKRSKADEPKTKEDSRQRALQLFATSPWFPLKMHHNRAEASLIAHYGLTLERAGGIARMPVAAE